VNTSVGSTVPQAKWADLGVRTLTSLLLVPVVLADVWLGGEWFRAAMVFLGVLIAFEWCLIAHGKGSGQFAIHVLAVACAVLLPTEIGFLPTVVMIFVFGGLSGALDRVRKRQSSAWTWLGPIYAALPVFALTVLRDHTSLGALAILWLLLIVWAADIFAYFAGRTIGGPKLSPRFSPKKTWAGLGGAVLGSAVVSMCFGLYFVPSSVVPLALLAALMALVEQAGDIFESAFKRHFGVKDSGTLIPGHGGIIDRVDGLLAVALAACIFGFLRNATEPAAGLLSW
jgi:phosphatidate cytidylyltransferase